jgi:hypothetical protein
MAAGGQEAALNEAAARIDRSGPFELRNPIAVQNAIRNPNYNVTVSYVPITDDVGGSYKSYTVVGVRDSNGV